MTISSNLTHAANRICIIENAIERVRFCRNVQRTIEVDQAENDRRLRQLLEAIDALLTDAR